MDNNNLQVIVLVATHKSYWMPKDKIYLPVHVGAEGKIDNNGHPLDLGYIKDNTGNNISSKNKNYCELTGLYWAWKNLEFDYLGLAHYRRHFTLKKKRNKKEMPITFSELIPILNQYDVILPKKRNYFIETNYNQYVHAHHKEDLDTTRAIIKEKYPEYLNAYDENMKKTSGHRFNMFIMSRDCIINYCEWLFDILFELESRLDITLYNTNDARVFGFVSERLLDVWIDTNHIQYKEIPYVFMEKQNWVKKGLNFLKRKVHPNNR